MLNGRKLFNGFLLSGCSDKIEITEEIDIIKYSVFRTIILILLCSGLLLVSGCGAARSHFNVIQGNYAYNQGKYQSATVFYLRALEQETYADYISYNLGNVYLSLGETQAALSMWQRAIDSESIDILFGIHFNRGILFYERGDYQASYLEFKNALKIVPSDVAAKKNLELAYLKLQNKATAAQSRGSENEGDQSPEDEKKADSLRVLEYVRRKESGKWFANDQVNQQEFQNDW